MNICVSSTINWNPGDEFIRYGVLYLLKKILGQEHNYFIWNRNPDFFKQGWKDDSLKTNFWSNSLQEKDLPFMDLFVLAGTPEWIGNPTLPIYQEVQRTKKPFLLLGVGSGRPLDQLTPLENEVLQNSTTLVCVRSAGLAQELKEKNIHAYTLPCPSLFCHSMDNQKGALTGKIGFLLQSSSLLNQQSDLRFVQEFWKIAPNPHYELMASYIDEVRENYKQGLACSFSFEPRDYFDMYKKCDWLVTTRLHGALSSLSCGVPAVLLADEANVRIQSTAALYKDILPVANSLQQALDFINSPSFGGVLPAYSLSGKAPHKLVLYSKIQGKIAAFRQNLSLQYTNLLQEFFKRYEKQTA